MTIDYVNVIHNFSKEINKNNKMFITSYALENQRFLSLQWSFKPHDIIRMVSSRALQ